MKLNAKMTTRKISHVLDWASACRAKYVWTKADQNMVDFLIKYKKQLLK